MIFPLNLWRNVQSPAVLIREGQSLPIILLRTNCHFLSCTWHVQREKKITKNDIGSREKLHERKRYNLCLH